MECNRDEALRAKEIAERKFTDNDIAGARKFAVKAQNLFPNLDGISQMIATLDVHLSAEEITNGEKDWYGVLSVDASADEDMVKKQYRKLALMLHPDKNKSIGAEAAFKLVSEAWSVLSDKSRRMAYDQKWHVKLAQKVSKSHSSSNGFHHFPNHASSNLRAQKNTARMGSSAVPSPCPPRPSPSTFWTACNRCKMQYEYLRVYLNHNLLCPNCHEPFLAVETGIPTNGHNSPIHWPSSQRKQPSNHKSIHGHEKKSSSKTRSARYQHAASSAASADAAHMDKHTYEKMMKQWEGNQGTTTFNDVMQRINVSKRTASGMPVGSSNFDREHAHSNMERPGKKRSISDAGINDNAGKESDFKASIGHDKKNISFSTVFPTERSNSVSGTRTAWRQTSSLSRDLSSLDVRNMLMKKAKDLVQKKLEDWSSADATKTAEKEKAKQKQKLKANEKEKEKTILHGNADDAPEEIKVNKSSDLTQQTPCEKVSSDDPHVGSDKEGPEPVSIDVPDPDFHDFDKDRSEKSFGPDQVWATYDDEDGMPRFYVLIQKVISLKPFKIRMSFLNSKTNSELGPLNWVGMGFAKTCGDFRVGRYEINEHINIFSHKVRWEKGTRGVIRVVPHKGDIWALYRNWSADWNEHTPDDVIYKYDMVEVLDDYNEEQGVTITPLVKVAGFKTVFHRHLDPKEVRRIPREEMFRFSHQVPSYLLTGTESENAPKGCNELDPAATPLELLQVITEAKVEEFGETSGKETVT